MAFICRPQVPVKNVAREVTRDVRKSLLGRLAVNRPGAKALYP